MNTTVTSYLESLARNGERFRSVKNMFPVTGSEGHIVFSVRGNILSVVVRYGSRRHVLSCALSGKLVQCTNEEAVACRQAANPYVAEWEELKRELLIFPPDGNEPVWADILLQPYLPAPPIDTFVRQRLFLGDKRPLRQLLKHIAAMSSSLYADRIACGTINPDNMIVGEDSVPICVNYPLRSDHSLTTDTYMMATSGLVAYIAASEPHIFRKVALREMFNPAFFPKFAPLVITQAEFMKNRPLKELALALTDIFNTPREEVNLNLERLARREFASMPLLSSLIDNCKDLDPHKPDVEDHYVAADIKRSDETMKVDFEKCVRKGSLSDTVVRFYEDGGWDYADKYGNRLTDSRFVEACDFYEGRAAVRTQAGWGLIDRTGKYIMDPMFEILEWHGRHNIVTACLNGRWELYDRMGRQRTSGGFEWMGNCSEDIVVVRRGFSYGYITREGTPLTAIRYDEAYSFSDGRALVKYNGENYYIDRQGQKLG